MKHSLYQVDSFTGEIFSGNPAGVCVMDKAASEDWMQNIAAEMNLSETAFLYPQNDGYNLRWFTPTIEVDLCGHATLASAHILWEQKLLDYNSEARFYTKSGMLTAKKIENTIELNFPSQPAYEVKPTLDLLTALAVKPVNIAKNDFVFLVEVESEEIVRNVNPDFIALSALPVTGVIVTSLSDNEKYDFVSRFFAPAAGINEDPVTGAAHCCLGPYWQKRLNKNELSAYQASKRGGELSVRVERE